MGVNCFLHPWSALGTLSLVWLTKIFSAFSSPRRFDFLQKKFFFFFVRMLGTMGGLIRGQWVDNGLEMIWDLIGNVWVEYRVMTWFMALWVVGEGVTMM